MLSRLPVHALIVLVILTSLVVAAPAAQAADVDAAQIFFPVQVTENLQYSDNWGDCRSGCSRRHLGVDIMTPQMTPVFAAQSGSIYTYRDYCNSDRTYCSYYLLVDGDDGRMYFYVHLNDDTPGRPNGCDHVGGFENAVSPRLFDAYQQGALNGLRVERGEHLGFAGSSGNAGCAGPHLHFEIWQGEGWDGHGDGQGSINPYPPARAGHDAGNFWGTEWPIEPVPTERVAGPDRVETAIKLSRRAYADGGAPTVVIAPASYYQEALVGAPLAATLGGPVLLAWPTSTDQRPAVADALVAEIARLGATSAVLIGAPSRLGNEVHDELVERTDLASEDITRLGSADPGELSADVATAVLDAHGITVPPREEPQTQAPAEAEDEGPLDDVLSLTTSRRSFVAAALAPSRTAAAAGDAEPAAEDQPAPMVEPFVAAGVHPSGKGWPDALAASVLGARQFAPVLLTPFDELHPDVARVLSAEGIGEVRITGGTAAVSQQVEDDIVAMDLTARRLFGSDRYTTSQAVAVDAIDDGASLEHVAVATGLNFPDALASGPVLALLDRTFVLVHGQQNHPSVIDWLRTNASKIKSLEIIGGSAAVADEVAEGSAVAANDPYEDQ